MNPKDGNSPPPSVPSFAADISASTSDPATVPYPPPSNPPLPTRVEGTFGTTVISPLTSGQVPMPPSVATFNGRDAALIGRTVLFIRASRSYQDRENLIQLLSISLLTYSPPLVEAVYSRLSSMSWLRAAKRADIKTLILPDGSAPSTDDIEDLLSIAQYSDR